LGHFKLQSAFSKIQDRCEFVSSGLNLRCFIPKYLYSIMGKGQSNTTIVDVKIYIIYNVKTGLHVSTLRSHLQALVV
jgi:hypothetical protein